MGRYSDPDSASSSFSMLLGDAPHLDGLYTIFGKVTKGDETLRKLEQLPTRKEGIFVMPTERITIIVIILLWSSGTVAFLTSSTGLVFGPFFLTTLFRIRAKQKVCEFELFGYPYFNMEQNSKAETCEEDRLMLRRRLAASAVEIERQRMKCFP
ncbi:Peptidyl-prolyl cis-trans isomerase CYP23 [Forsythia ovata]|uniref:Peptidyl-prolyl cis-trans isomerase CYP23 n=1 Tax=Forsythia ovata TaxID=205694 RepID=A0ABD1TBR8_9LAMI